MISYIHAHGHILVIEGRGKKNVITFELKSVWKISHMLNWYIDQNCSIKCVYLVRNTYTQSRTLKLLWPSTYSSESWNHKAIRNWKLIVLTQSRYIKFEGTVYKLDHLDCPDCRFLSVRQLTKKCFIHARIYEAYILQLSEQLFFPEKEVKISSFIKRESYRGEKIFIMCFPTHFPWKLIWECSSVYL